MKFLLNNDVRIMNNEHHCFTKLNIDFGLLLILGIHRYIVYNT